MKLRHALLVLALAAPSALEAQRIVSQPQQIISVSKGASALLVNPVAIVRVTIGDPAIANASVVSPTEVLINGASLGSTTLLVWDNAGTPRVYSVEVTADAPALQRYIKALLPEEEILVTSSGNTVTLSGTVKSQISAFRAVQLANTTGATVIDNLFTPPAQQVLLKVRFAEVSKSFTRD
ncbi:MAG TPA: pilus assembly protein N-terminal domain-containing protein, partial [Gemmatimonadales bacterium]|nr:pilus assembly protein N-terminal domain-containing protein [Gemmatimonadales bacterium]